MVRKAEVSDLEILATLAILMWGTHTIQELVSEFFEIMQKEDAQFFLKYNQDKPVGFAQCQLRYDYVEGTENRPVGYLEGNFV